ncbi:MAG: hypothetical protein FWH46_04740 [Methanimicrococcus sp.]|nr:hypothetical protein [Methanimicrococcus sp.]
MDFENGLKKGFDVWKNNLAAFIVGCIIVLLPFAVVLFITLFITFIAASLFGSFLLMTGASLISIAIQFIVAFFVIIPLCFGLIYMAIKGARDDIVEIKDVFYSFNSLHGYIRSLIFAAVVLIPFIILNIIGMIPFIGFILLLFYPIIVFVAAFFLTFAIYIYIMVPSKNLMYAITESFNIAKDNFLITFILIVVCLILNLIGAILLGLGLFVTIPVTQILVALALKELKPDLIDQSH